MMINRMKGLREANRCQQYALAELGGELLPIDESREGQSIHSALLALYQRISSINPLLPFHFWPLPPCPFTLAWAV
jgi:hypothetical protein